MLLREGGRGDVFSEITRSQESEKTRSSLKWKPGIQVCSGFNVIRQAGLGWQEGACLHGLFCALPRESEVRLSNQTDSLLVLVVLDVAPLHHDANLSTIH